MKKSRAALSIFLSAGLVLTLAAGCSGKTGSESSSSGSSSQAAAPVSISFLNSKGEIATPLSEAVKSFESSHKGVTVTIDSVSASSTIDQLMMAKYASGNPETMSMVDHPDISVYAGKSMDLSGQDWVKDIKAGVLSAVKFNGKVACFPFAVEGYGMIYNKTTIEKATKSTFDPASIKNISDLSALYQKIQSAGVAPVEISSDNWSLAGHFLTTVFARNGGDS